MSTNFLIIGAASAMAKATSQLLQANGGNTIGISRGDCSSHYTKTFQVTDYRTESLPEINEPISGLVYFPGSIRLKPFNRISKEEFLEDYSISVMGAIETIQKYLPNLKKQGNSSLVLISSVAASTGMPFHASVGSAKAAIEGLTLALAAEFAPVIRVNCIAPSLVNTPLAEKFLSSEEKKEAMKKRNPSQMVGESEDIAEMVAYILSEKSRYMSGQIIRLDGGHSTLRT